MTARSGGSVHPSPPFPDRSLPPGTRARAAHLAGSIVGLVNKLVGLDALDNPARFQVDHDLLDAHLLLPYVIAAANHLPPPVAAAEPVAAPGGGWVMVDIGPDDASTWTTLQAVLADEVSAGASPPDAEHLACRAHEWRLAVTPYRLGTAATSSEPSARRVTAGKQSGPGHHVDVPRPAASSPDRPLEGVRIIDLTAMWAGPLATWLAATLGADVIKIEAACRRDGFRNSPRPATAGPGDGCLFVALNHGKTHAELDLRLPSDHEQFRELVNSADIVVDSFSPRVRPNLDIAVDRLASWRPGLIDLSLTAFSPLGAHADWVAYGGGVHATSGLAFPTGITGEAEMARSAPRPTPVPYADPLAGLEVLLALLGALIRRRGGGPGPWRIECSLEQAVAPLVGVVAHVLGEARLGGRASTEDRTSGQELESWATWAALRTVVADGCAVLRTPLLRDHSQTERSP